PLPTRRSSDLESDDPGIGVAKPLPNPVTDLAALGTRFDPASLREVPQHSALTETAFLHAPAERRGQNVHPTGIAIGAVARPSEPLHRLRLAPGRELGRVLVHPAANPLQRPVGLAGGRGGFELG